MLGRGSAMYLIMRGLILKSYEPPQQSTLNHGHFGSSQAGDKPDLLLGGSDGGERRFS